MQLPDIWRYNALLTQRDQGMMMVVAMVVIGLGLLVEGRVFYRRWLPAIRTALVALFYISLFLIVAIKALSS